MGLLGVTVSSEYGGVELGYFQHTLAMEAISEASGSVALSYGGACSLRPFIPLAFPIPRTPLRILLPELILISISYSSLEPVCEPDSPAWHGRAEGEVPPGTDLWQEGREPRNERDGERERCREHADEGGQGEGRVQAEWE